MLMVRIEKYKLATVREWIKTTWKIIACSSYHTHNCSKIVSCSEAGAVKLTSEWRGTSDEEKGTKYRDSSGEMESEERLLGVESEPLGPRIVAHRASTVLLKQPFDEQPEVPQHSAISEHRLRYYSSLWNIYSSKITLQCFDSSSQKHR